MVGSSARSRSTLAANSSVSVRTSLSADLRRARARPARASAPKRELSLGHSAPITARPSVSAVGNASGTTIAPVRELLSDLDRWRARGERVALARVVATRRSAPRPVGSKLAVSERGELAGSVSGGCVENEVYDVAREVLRGGEPRLLTYGISDDLALSVGLPCGGEIDVWVDEPDPALLERLADLVREDARAVVLTDLETGTQRLAVDGEDAHTDELIRGGHSRVVQLDGRRVFADVFGPPPRLLVYGAVDTADSLCAAAKELGWRTIVVDARGKFATRERLPD